MSVDKLGSGMNAAKEQISELSAAVSGLAQKAPGGMTVWKESEEELRTRPLGGVSEKKENTWRAGRSLPELKQESVGQTGQIFPARVPGLSPRDANSEWPTGLLSVFKHGNLLLFIYKKQIVV